MDRREIYDFLRRHRYGVVSSMSADGLPQSALVGIAITPMFDVVFDTLKISRKYPNLLRNPRCSFVIGWTGEQTLQLEGDVEEPAGDELRRLQRIYLEVWPDSATRMSLPGTAYLVVRAKWLRYSDYDQSPPLIWETNLDSQR